MTISNGVYIDNFKSIRNLRSSVFGRMFSLTSQERKALLFVAGLLILGAALNYILKVNPWCLESIKFNSESSEVKKININTTTLEELIKIPGIGEVTAYRIISYRNQYGSFKSIEDLEKVKGIGKKKLELIKKYIVLH